MIINKKEQMERQVVLPTETFSQRCGRHLTRPGLISEGQSHSQGSLRVGVGVGVDVGVGVGVGLPRIRFTRDPVK
jgi:hypothetical protein